MIHSILIEGYRGFDRFEMTGLGRINLLVGTNNSGKTSVLEALYLLTSRGDPVALWQLLWRRGERLPEERNPRYPQPELDVCHLFTGHDLHIGSKFSFSAKNQSPEQTLAFTVAEPTQKERNLFMGVHEGPPIRSPLMLRVSGLPAPLSDWIPLSRRSGIPSEVFESPRRGRRGTEDAGHAQFITTESLTGDELVPLWDKIALTPDEALVLRSLQFLNHDIERIASISTPNHYAASSRAGFKIKHKKYEQPIPIGSMGDGMWRMLAMAIAITQCKGGMLLVDEIDTGLHYSVMSEMWKLIFGAAKEFGVQVFATSHSYDCVHALAKICINGQDPNNRVTLQRIEVGKRKAVPYTEGEIKIAAERQIEVR